MIVRTVLLTFLLATLFAAPAYADHPNPGEPPAQDKLPRLLQGVKIDQKLDAQVPADLQFLDESGRPVRFGDYLGKRPVILTMNYFDCPQLCPVILDGLTLSLLEVPFTMGKEYDVVTVSVDPREKPELAAQAKKGFVKKYGHNQAAATGWHFLTGSESSVQRLADTVGFRYRYDAKTDSYAHPSGIVILTPQGRVSRYFFGIGYPARDVKLGLVEASNNKIGSLIDHAMLFCYEYNPETGQYGLIALNIVRLAGILTVLAMVSGIIYLLRSERRRPRDLQGGIG